MKENNIKPITAEWLKKSQEDEEAVKALSKEKVSFSVICFLSQQIAEKCLKAYLAEYDLRIPKIHQLEKLLGECKKISLDFDTLSEEVISLSEYYIESRYPGDYPEGIGEKEALEARKSALKIKDFIINKLGI